MLLVDSFVYSGNIFVLKGSQMLLFEQNNRADRVLRSGHDQSAILRSFVEMCGMHVRKWFLLACLLSFWIFEG